MINFIPSIKEKNYFTDWILYKSRYERLLNKFFFTQIISHSSFSKIFSKGFKTDIYQSMIIWEIDFHWISKTEYYFLYLFGELRYDITQWVSIVDDKRVSKNEKKKPTLNLNQTMQQIESLHSQKLFAELEGFVILGILRSVSCWRTVNHLVLWGSRLDPHKVQCCWYSRDN